MWSISLNVIKFEFLNYAAFGFHSLLNIMRDFECDRDACWTWLIFDVLNVNVWNVHVECDVWPWIWSRCLLNLINFHVLNANVIVECDRYPWMWSNLNSWILHHLAFHILFFQVKMFTRGVSVLLTSTSLEIKKLKLAEATRETEHRSVMHSAPRTGV